MIIKEIKDYNSFEFKQSIDIYESSFPFNETRPFEDIVNLLRNDKNYHLIVSLNNNSVIGISLMYIFRSLNIGLLDYMAISPSFRRQGVGKEIFNFTFEKLCSIITNGIGLLIEIQKENNLLDLQEITIRKNRIGFYNKLGVKLLDKVNYLLPPIYPSNKEEVEEMYLLIKPIKEIYYLSKEQVIRYINIIYSTIYKYYDNDLLDKISSNIAEKIILRSLVL